MARKDKIKLANNNSVRFPVPNEMGNMLLIGNFDGVCGTLCQLDNGKYTFGIFSDALRHNGTLLLKTLQAGKHIYLISTEETHKYFQRLLTIFRDKGWLDKVGRDKAIRRQYHWCELDCTKEDTAIIDCVNNRLYNGLNEMKFENIIQNPPYNGTLHFKFMELGIKMLTSTGTMTIIEPATWLINLRKNGDAEMYNVFKDRIEGHIKSVVIENLNKDFNIANDMPFATTTIDMSQTFHSIEFVCCGEKRENITSIYDCNLIGNYNTIWSIFDKVMAYGDSMSNHIYNSECGTNYEAYLRYWNYQLYALGSNYGKVVNQYNSKSIAVYRTLDFGSFFSSYVDSLYYKDVKDTIPLSRSNNECDCLCGTKEELENWKYNVEHNRLFLFLTMCTTYDKNNNATDIVPFVCDKKYTNDEVNALFGFTEEEVSLINHTVARFEYDGEWFKRYMCGKGSVSDDDVNNFVKSIMD